MNTQRAIREYQDNSDPYRDELPQPYVGPFVKSYLDALSAAEREALCANGEPVELTFWQLIAEEFRENEAGFIGGALLWLVLLGIGCVAVAVKQGWLS